MEDCRDLLAQNYKLLKSDIFEVRESAEVEEATQDLADLDRNFLGLLKPENFVRKCLESKQIVATVGKLPLMTVNAPEPARKLMDHQIRLYNTEMRLKKSRQKVDKALDILSQRWADLEQKEEQLRENFILFSKFVMENVNKRDRAAKTMELQKTNMEARQKEIDNLLEDMADIKEIQERMERHIERNGIFKAFLEQVCFVSPDFKYKNQLITRFEELIEKKQVLSESQKNNMDELEKGKFHMMKLIEEKNFVIMGLNNQIANLQARYENANIKALESEELVTQIKNNAVKQMGEIDTVKNSIWNVYVHMASSKKHPIKIKKDNVEEQMMYINRTLTELNKVNKLIKKRATKAAIK